MTSAEGRRKPRLYTGPGMESLQSLSKLEITNMEHSSVNLDASTDVLKCGEAVLTGKASTNTSAGTEREQS